MAEGEREADANRLLPLLHELARRFVDGGDMVGVSRVPQAERLGGERGTEQDGVVVQRRGRPRARPGRSRQ